MIEKVTQIQLWIDREGNKVLSGIAQLDHEINILNGTETTETCDMFLLN